LKIVRDGIDPEAVHKAFLTIAEYRDVIALRLHRLAPNSDRTTRVSAEGS
jgi:hypothetical protein